MKDYCSLFKLPFEENLLELFDNVLCVNVYYMYVQLCFNQQANRYCRHGENLILL